MFPIDKRLVQVVLYPAPDVVPAVIFAVDDVPMSTWNAASNLDELADAIEPFLRERGARRWDFVWSMERHFSEPYGPLPKATQSFMAGIPDLFLASAGAGASGTGARIVEEGLLSAQSGLNRVTQSDVEVQADPFQFDAGDEMPDDYLFWLRKLCFAHGECMTPYFGEEAKGHVSIFMSTDQFGITAAPDAETRLRMNNFVSEEFKHTYMFYKLYSELDPSLPVEIYEREREVFRAYESMQMEQTWGDRCLYNLLSDRFGVYQGFEWVQSSYAPLARVSLKVVKDERGHSNMGYLHARDYIEREPEGREYLAERIRDYWYPYFMASFGADDSKNNLEWRRFGLKQHTNPQLRQAFHAEMVEVLESLGITPPDADKALERGLELSRQARNR